VTHCPGNYYYYYYYFFFYFYFFLFLLLLLLYTLIHSRIETQTGKKYQTDRQTDRPLHSKYAPIRETRAVDASYSADRDRDLITRRKLTCLPATPQDIPQSTN